MSWMRRNHVWRLVGWLVVLVAAILLTPDTNKLVAEKGQITIPSSYQSQRATKLQDKWGSSQKNTTAVVAVFSNGDHKLTASQNKAIDKTITKLKQDKNKYQIKAITTAQDSATAKAQLVAKDKTTQLVQMNVKLSTAHSRTKIRSELTKAAKTSGVKTYITGSDILNQDFSDATQKGVQKTEVIAAVFIFFVLLLVFRSPITPLISLFTVGVSGLVSISVVTNLVKHFGFPFSNFTQVFIIIVLFGIGTDYNILLYNQFREEMAHGKSARDASKSAIKIGGRTVLYSGVSVLIGMTVLAFARFSLYRSAVGIAVGVVVLLAVLLTLNPFFMTVLGPRMFWPVKKFSGEGNSRLWHTLGSTSMIRPILSLVIMGVVMLPLAFVGHGILDYDDTVEISDTVPAKEGFKLVQKHFSKGTAEPTTIYISSKHKLNNEESLQIVDRVTGQLKKTTGVKTVLSASQPGGSEIKALYVRNQMATVTGGLTKSQQGINQINSGLTSAKQQLDGANISGGVSSAQELATGSQQVASGTAALSSGISQVTTGVNELNSQLQSSTGGSQQAQLQQLETALPQLNAAISSLNQQVSAASTGSTSGIQGSLTTIGDSTKDIGTQLKSVQTARSSMTTPSVDASQLVAQMQGNGANLTSEQQATVTAVINGALQQQSSSTASLQKQVSDSLSQIGSDAQTIGSNDQSVATQLQTLQASTSQLQQAISQLNTASNQVLPASATAISQLSGGLTQLTSSTAQLASAMGTINGSTGTLTSGANQVASGNVQMASKLSELGNETQTLSDGLGSATTGLGTISAGSKSVNSYLGGLKDSSAAKTYYIPKEQLTSKTFAPVMKTYFSPSKKITKITVILDDDPSSQAAMNRLPRLEAIVKGALKGTSLNDAEVAFGGTTSQTNDTNEMASSDFSRTAIIMLAGIFIALMVVTRSLVQPIAIEATLLIAYSSATNIVYWLVKTFLGQSMLTWNTPFFAFVMLISLGVDYSIFLMSKYREFLHEPTSTDARMLKATTIIGTVVISVGIILSGDVCRVDSVRCHDVDSGCVGRDCRDYSVDHFDSDHYASSYEDHVSNPTVTN
ncbi:MMPL family transporter [Furfurilactobacillus entadae]|uniref:MMPL family transporter n=1 Tax=Furfurilactobacillus entadae TaxID=2922307 RepID=UPI0038B3E8B1